MIRQVEYFEKPGKENTLRCLEIVENLGKEGYKDLVIASTWGDTGLTFAKKLQDKMNIVMVTHNVGYGGPNVDECSQEARKELQSLGVRIYTGTILTRGIEAALMKKQQGVSPQYVVAMALRLICQGIKVGIEIVAEACDGGLISEGTDVIAVAGTGRGADTVSIIEAHPSDRFFDIKVKQILAKPM